MLINSILDIYGGTRDLQEVLKPAKIA